MNIIKINNKEYDFEYDDYLLDNWVKNGDLAEYRKGEYFWTKKYFVKMVLGLSKIVPVPDKINFYLLALRLQFTDLYSRVMVPKIN